MAKKRIIFMGTPEFSVKALEYFEKTSHEVVAVYTQPPKPVGRGYKLTKSPVHLKAESLGIPVEHPKTLRSADARARFKHYQPDVVVVVAYGLILPSEILNIPPFGCLNIHASILPRWRGAAPIQYAILNGDKISGLTLMKMDEGMDTGPLIGTIEYNLSETETSSHLFTALLKLQPKLLENYFDGYLSGKIQPIPQPKEGVTYASKISKEEGRIDWHAAAKVISQKIRAFSGWPGTWFLFGDEKIKVLEATYNLDETISTPPGMVLDEHLNIGTSRGVLVPEVLQRAGKSPLNREEFLRGLSIPKGTMLE